jgi:amino-acid N-acetyltransferase
MSPASPDVVFSEKAFYLQEFRGRTLLFALPADELANAGALSAVVGELSANGVRCVVVASDAAGLEKLVGAPPLAADLPSLPAATWRRLRARPVAGVVTADAPLGPETREVARRLGAGKLVVLDPAGGWTRPDGSQASFVSLDELRAAEDGDRPGLLADVRALLEAGIPAVNLCSQAGLADELFTYAGSGTLFTRERYVDVRRLGVEDFDAAADLIARGVEEGYLAPRSPEEVDAILSSGFGAFVEGVHLAGIGALVIHTTGRSGEIASLYTLTRFLGEGIGAHLVAFAVEEAARRGLERLFACTTSERVAAFFERNGFARVAPEALPEEKWRAYEPERRARLVCLARDA